MTAVPRPLTGTEMARQEMAPAMLALAITIVHLAIALSSDGLNLAGIRRVPALQEETAACRQR
jgi:hypothetical protein